jgi:hypothetical protein
MKNRPLAVMVMLSALAGVIQAESPATQPATRSAEGNARVNRLIKQLGNDNYDERAAAQKTLVEMGLPVVLALEMATGNPDAEISARAKAALIDIAQAKGQVNHPVNLYKNAADFLQAGGARRAAAQQFEVAAALGTALADPEDRPKVARGAGELAEALRVMADEDEAFKEPKDPAALPEPKRIEYYIFKLRDVAAQQFSTPGKCQVFMFTRDNAAWALRRIGKPAIPALLALLDDRRPTRSTADQMSGGYVLRYGDVALQTIEAIAAQHFDTQTTRGSYLTNADATTRRVIVESVQDWWEKNRDKTESQWIREAAVARGVGDWTERLVELDGAASVEFFRQRMAAEPDNWAVVRLLWQAGGKSVLEDMRRAANGKHVYVRSAAYRALLEAGEKDVVDAVRKDLQQVPAGQPADLRGLPIDSRGSLLGALTYSGTREGVMAAAEYMRNADAAIACEAMRQVFRADSWKPFAPELVEALLPYAADAMNNPGFELNERYWAAWWLNKKAKIADVPDQAKTPEEQTQAIAQVQAWWAAHLCERAAPATQPGR